MSRKLLSPALVAALVLGAPLGARQDPPPPATTSAELDAALAAAVVAVLTPPASGEAPDPAAMAQAIVKLGTPAIPAVVAALSGELDVPIELPDGSGEPVHPAALAARDEVLGTALRAFEPRAVVEHLAARSQGDAPMDFKLFAAGLLGELDDAGALPALLAITSSIEPIHLRRTYVQQSLEGGIASQLERRTDSLAQLERAAKDAGPELTCVLARSVARVRSARCLQFLLRQLGHHAEADPVILVAIGKSAGDGGLAVDPADLAELRDLLTSPEPATQRAAAATIGRLRDEESFDTLAALMGGRELLVAAAAHWSLTQLTGKDLGDDPRVWLDWKAAEDAWWQESGPGLIANLRSDDPAAVHEAIGVLVQHPLVRHEVSDALGPILLQADPDLAIVACSALARLGSARSLDWLVSALSSDDRPLRMQALTALEHLTGLDLPADPLAWGRVVKG